PTSRRSPGGFGCPYTDFACGSLRSGCDRGSKRLLPRVARYTKRQLSENLSFTETYGIRGATIAFSDDLVGDGSSLLDTHDIKLADLSAHALSTERIASGAYLNFFPPSIAARSSSPGPRGPRARVFTSRDCDSGRGSGCRYFAGVFEMSKSGRVD